MACSFFINKYRAIHVAFRVACALYDAENFIAWFQSTDAQFMHADAFSKKVG